jgi:HSP20 family protein
MERVFDEDGPVPAGGAWPAVDVHDTGAALRVVAEVPGIREKDLQLTVNQDVLTLSGERPVETPEGSSVHRQERPALKFSRSFALPCRIDLEKVSARLAHGVLTITLPRAADSQPRQIAVKAS